jgi:iron complex outermembrane receptor protein
MIKTNAEAGIQESGPFQSDNMKHFIYSIFVLLSIQYAAAQQTVRGKILDGQTGEPLPGASISLLHDSAATLSGDAGEFEITVPAEADSIRVSYIGYRTQQVEVSNNTRYINIALETGTASLNHVTVTGYENNRRLLETAGSIAMISSGEIHRGNDLSIQQALNTVPGVKMESNAPGNFKISLRGSALRDPYGVRNLKLYWNDIPLTSPDNSASHTLDFDPSQIGSIEIIKGPSGSIYGAGNGGVIIFKNIKPAYHENDLTAGVTAGSFGLSRLNTVYKTATDNFNLTAAWTHQRYNGYRENEWNNKDAVSLTARFYISPARTVSLLLDHSEGSLGIAGSVDSSWAVNTPRKAVPFCKDNKTGVQHYSYTLAGVSQLYRFSDRFSNTTAIYSSSQILSHPYGQSIYYNGYLKQNFDGIGGRSYFTYSPKLAGIKSRFTLGTELQYENQLGSTFDIVNDVPGTAPETGNLQSSNIIRSFSDIFFAQAAFDLPAGFLLTLGASYNHLSYNVTDLVPQGPSHNNYTGEVRFKSDLSPRIALVKTFNKNMAVHASISSGFSPPTVFETINGNGTFNRSLGAEKGVNYELGFRGTILDNHLNFDASVYRMNVTNAILPVYNQYGTASFVNAGALNERGFELSLFYLVVQDPDQTVSLLKPWLSYSFMDYVFSTYTKESFDYNNNVPVKSDYSGKAVTGVTPHTLNAGVDLEMKCGFHVNAVLNYISRTPVNDANTYFQHAYTLLASRVGYRIRFGRFDADLSAGGQNLLNANYSSMVNINADANGGALFYNPSPACNFYGGLTLTYHFNR